MATEKYIAQIKRVIGMLVVTSGALAIFVMWYDRNLEKPIETHLDVDAQQEQYHESLALESFSPKEIMSYLSQFIVLLAEEAVAEQIKVLPFKKLLDVVTLLLESKEWQAEHKFNLLSSLIATGKYARDEVDELLARASRYPELWEKSPFRKIIVQYPQVIKVFIDWESRTKKEQSKTNGSLSFRALQEAIIDNDTEYFSGLINAGARISSGQATDLAWFAVERNASAAILEQLLYKGASFVEPRSGKTLLILATERNQPEQVRFFVEHGLHPKQIVDPAIGSALQIAISRQQVELEQILRARGK